jgi:hypothetical protein
VVDEGALRRTTGGPKVMAEQLRKLVEISGLPNVSIQVLPYAAGTHPALESNFNILEFLGPASGVVYAEGLAGNIYLERAEDLAKYWKVFARLQEIALSSADTIGLVADILRSYVENRTVHYRKNPAV